MGTASANVMKIRYRLNESPHLQSSRMYGFYAVVVWREIAVSRHAARAVENYW
jgi:hypothetical protein